MQQSQQSEQSQQILQENQFPQDKLINTKTISVVFNNNSEDFQLKISHYQNAFSQENKFHLVLFSDSELHNDVKFTSNFILEQEIKKQKVLLSVFDFDKPDNYSQNIYDLLKNNDYSIINGNNFNEQQVKIEISYKKYINREDIQIKPVEFLLQREIPQNQCLEETVIFIQQNINKKAKIDKQFQQETKQQLQNHQQILEQILLYVKKNENVQEKVENIQHNNNQFQTQSLKNQKIIIDQQNDQNKLTLQKIEENQINILQSLEKNNYQKILENLQNTIDNNEKQLNESLQTYYNNRSKFLKEKLDFTQNQIQKQVNSKIDEILNKKIFKKLEQKVTENNNDLINILLEENEQIDFEQIFNKKIPQKVQRFLPPDQQLLKKKFQLLKEQVKLVQDPIKLLFLVTTIPQLNLQKLNPKHLIQFNVQHFTSDNFKKQLQGQTNCLIIAKVKERENSEDEFYAGFAPDSTIFKEGDGGYQKTEQNESYQCPYTLDLNLFVKRNLINKDTPAYYCSDSYYFVFNSGEFVILNEKNNFKIYFGLCNDQYLSTCSEENHNRKIYNLKEMYKIEVEVIKLF